MAALHLNIKGGRTTSSTFPGDDRFDATLESVSEKHSMLIRLSGPDKPGIAAALFDLLSHHEATLQDVEQITIRGHLTLGVVVADCKWADIQRDLLMFGYDREIAVDFEEVSSTSTTTRQGLVATLIGNTIDPSEFSAFASVIAAEGGNIRRIVRLAQYPVMAFELLISGADTEKMRLASLQLGQDMRCDVAVHHRGIGRRAARLVVLDVDSTLIQDEAVELLAKEADCLEQVKKITDQAMAGELDFAESLEARVALLAGLEAEALDRVKYQITLTRGARTFMRTLRRLGYRTGIVSGGFTCITDHLSGELSIDHSLANTLEVVDGKLTGRISGEIVDRARKAQFVREISAAEKIPLDQVVAIGDGANDLDMLNVAGLGIAFNAKPVVRKAADTTVNVPYLDAVLFVLGVSRDDIEDADTKNSEA